MLIFIGLLFSLIGFGVVISGIFSLLKLRRQLADSVKVLGTVTAFGKTMGKGGYLYCPQVEFQTPDGQTVRFQSKVGSQPPSYQVGQQVPVVYQINNPNQAEINSLTALWFVPGCMFVMGVFFSGLGLILLGFGILVQLKT